MNTERVHDVAGRRTYDLDISSPVGAGYEANVYAVRDEPGLVAKVYHTRRPDQVARLPQRAKKLAVMLANPPKNPNPKSKHDPYAWPTALISKKKGRDVIGFVMPRVSGMKEIFEFYNPGQRLKTCPRFTYRYLFQTARNIASIMSEVHSLGYVIGDVNQKNIVVSDSASVTLLDTDSFQVRDPKTGFVHLCTVRTDGFIAPEVYHSRPSVVERHVAQDLFGLSVLVFHLLMEGVHPFSCRYLGAGEPPKLQQNVLAGAFCYGRQCADYAPMPAAPPFELLPEAIQRLFARCFVEGHADPAARPTAHEWRMELTHAVANMRECTTNKQHWFGTHLGDCPWCLRVNQGRRDPFPSAVQPASENGHARQAADVEAPKSESGPVAKRGFVARHKVAIAILLALAAFALSNLRW